MKRQSTTTTILLRKNLLCGAVDSLLIDICLLLGRKESEKLCLVSRNFTRLMQRVECHLPRRIINGAMGDLRERRTWNEWHVRKIELRRCDYLAEFMEREPPRYIYRKRQRRQNPAFAKYYAHPESGYITLKLLNDRAHEYEPTRLLDAHGCIVEHFTVRARTMHMAQRIADGLTRMVAFRNGTPLNVRFMNMEFGAQVSSSWLNVHLEQILSQVQVSTNLHIACGSRKHLATFCTQYARLMHLVSSASHLTLRLSVNPHDEFLQPFLDILKSADARLIVNFHVRILGGQWQYSFQEAAHQLRRFVDNCHFAGPSCSFRMTFDFLASTRASTQGLRKILIADHKNAEAVDEENELSHAGWRINCGDRSLWLVINENGKYNPYTRTNYTTHFVSIESC